MPSFSSRLLPFSSPPVPRPSQVRQAQQLMGTRPIMVHFRMFWTGTVEISINGGNDWTPLVPSIVPTISSGDIIMTGSDGLLLALFSGGKILLGENTNFTYVDPGHHHYAKLLLGIMWAELQSLTGGSDEIEADIGPNAVVGVRGTEFTATAYENGTANVMVLEGLIDVQDLASNSTVSLQANQTITVPNVSGGLSGQELLQGVETVNPNSTGTWWKEPLAALTPSSTTLGTTTIVVYVGGVVVVAVVVAGALVLYIRRRNVKHESNP